MSGWWCCGCEGCQFLTDDFTRGDSTTVGGSWVEQSGDWEISSNRLIVSDSDALLNNTTAQPISDEQMRHKATIRATADGDQLRVIVAYLDTNNYLYAQFEFDSTCGELTLWEVISGTHTQIGDTIPVRGDWLDADHILSVCYDSGPCCPDESDDSAAFGADGCIGTLRAIFNNTHIASAFDVAAPTGGYYVGLGTGTLTGTATFDDVTAYRIEEEANCRCRLPNCFIMYDGFDRSALGCEWSTLSGTPSIVSNALELDSGDSVLSLRPTPRCAGSYKVTVEAVLDSSGDSYRIIFDYEDSDNYHYVEITGGNSPTGNIAIVERVGGTETTLHSDSEDIALSHTAAVCFTDGLLIDVNIGAITVEQEASAVFGRYAGLSGTGGTATFGSFTYELTHSDDDPLCDDCVTYTSICSDGSDVDPKTVCEGDVFSTYMKVTLSGLSCPAFCPGVSGSYILGYNSISCNWAFTDLTLCSGGLNLELYICRDDNDRPRISLRVDMTVLTPLIGWFEWAGDPGDPDIDCVSLDEFEVPRGSSSVPVSTTLCPGAAQAGDTLPCDAGGTSFVSAI